MDIYFTDPVVDRIAEHAVWLMRHNKEFKPIMVVETIDQALKELDLRRDDIPQGYDLEAFLLNIVAEEKKEAYFDDPVQDKVATQSLALSGIYYSTCSTVEAAKLRVVGGSNLTLAQTGEIIEWLRPIAFIDELEDLEEE